MEIRDPIHGTLAISKNETKVLDSPAFQRLRMIKQLGFSEFSFQEPHTLATFTPLGFLI